MGCSKYPFPPEIKKDSPARLLYVTSAEDESDWPSFRHAHPFTELLYVRAGEGRFLIDDISFPIRRDDLIIINPHVLHTEISSENAPLSYIALGVEGMRFSFENQSDYLILDHALPKRSLPFYFSSLLSELERKQAGYETVCCAMLDILMTELSRITGSVSSLPLAPSEDQALYRLKRYLDTRYQENITLDTLSALTHLNKYHLVHRFTKAYGQSPISYLNECRLKVSRDLLEHTDHSIAQIARLTGFSSQCYFAQSFKKCFGMSAGAYRKEKKQGRQSAVTAALPTSTLPPAN